MTTDPERLDVLIDRACRGALTPGEGQALREDVRLLDSMRQANLDAACAATARAERAEQQLAQAREVLADLHPRGIDLPNHCRCGELYPCATIRALGDAQQPATSEERAA